MQTEFTYRELSEKLDINLAKLKRWGREFLPPDYSAGQSQGVARELSIDAVFSLYVAGHLVSSLKYSIPETKIIMNLLVEWIKAKNLMPSNFSLINILAYRNNWGLTIYFDARQDECWFSASGILNSVRHEKSEERHQNFSITQQKRTTEEIIEEIFRHEPNYGLLTLVTGKFLDIHFVCLDFLGKIMGMNIFSAFQQAVDEYYTEQQNAKDKEFEEKDQREKRKKRLDQENIK
jgi:hypothetical protein